VGVLQEKTGGMEITVDLQVFVPAFDDAVDLFIGVLQLFGVDDDGFIGIFKKIGHYRT
jgi:hypothetical protein